MVSARDNQLQEEHEDVEQRARRTRRKERAGGVGRGCFLTRSELKRVLMDDGQSGVCLVCMCCERQGR
jgi:hypothetical protein